MDRMICLTTPVGRILIKADNITGILEKVDEEEDSRSMIFADGCSFIIKESFSVVADKLDEILRDNYVAYEE